jgi:DNA-binding CsgD family transcriptional regulator
MISKLFENHHTTMPLSDLLSAFESKTSCISIKNTQRTYAFANSNFAQLMGLQEASQLLALKDLDLTDNKDLLHTIKHDDEYILETAQSLKVCEELYPNFAPHLVKKVSGSIHPIFYKDEKTPRFILGIFNPMTQLLSLDFDTLCSLPFSELCLLLPTKNNTILFQGMNFSLSKREVEVILGLIRGMHAGEVAASLHLKQTTVESYIQNIKNKFGLSLKSELISAILENNVLKQILL